MGTTERLAGAISAFFTGAGYEPHGVCLLWSPGLVLLNVVSDSLIALAYFSIPVLLLYFIRRRKDIPFGSVFVMFGLFIVACGITHALSVYELWHGAYWLSGVAKAATAAVSVATAFVMVPLIPKALALRSPAELEAINRDLTAMIAEKNDTVDKLEREYRITSLIREHYLPTLPEPAAGVSFDAVYLPAEVESQLGGDWYSAMALPDGRYVISIGDVVGHGMEAAIGMDRIRTAISMGSVNSTDLGEALTRVNNLIRIRGLPFATACVAILDPKTLLIEYAIAGHPPPLFVSPELTLTEPESGGPLLGAVQDGGYRSRVCRLAVGSRVVFFTDGLIEFSRNLPAGEARLNAIVCQAVQRKSPASEIVDLTLSGAQRPDDIAVLVLSIDR